jgi:hypothetical protein
MSCSILTLRRSKQLGRRLRTLVILAAVGIVSWLAFSRFSPSSWPGDFVPARPNEPSAPIEFGTMVAGGKAQKQFRLQPRFEPLARIARVTTSCPCVTVTFSEPSIPTSRAIDALFTIDLSTEPGFSGGLSPEVRVFDAADRELLCIEVKVNVLSSNPDQEGAGP